MTMKFVTCCWLLVALAGTTALAQTHPKKKPIRKQAVGRRVTKSVSQAHQPPLLPPANEFIEISDCRLFPPPTVENFAPDTAHVYTYVEHMPTIGGRPAVAASIAVIEQYLVVPPAAPDGRVFVGFEVTKAGVVRHVRILKGLRADLDSAVVRAARQLPRFTPGKQSGQAVTVSIALAVTVPVKKQP